MSRQRLQLVQSIKALVGDRLVGQCREGFPDIPWSEAIGMRNRVVQAYFDINFNIVWDLISFGML